MTSSLTRVLSGISTLRVYLKLNTGSRPDDTLSANSEMVPVGAMAVSVPLRIPCAAIFARTSSSRPATFSPAMNLSRS